MKTSWRDLCKTSWRRLEDVFKTFWISLEAVLKMSLKTSWRRLEDVFARYLKDVLQTYDQDVYVGLDQDVLKTSSEDVWVKRIFSSWSGHLEVALKTSSGDEDERRPQDVFKTSSSRRMFAGLVLLDETNIFEIGVKQKELFQFNCCITVVFNWVYYNSQKYFCKEKYFFVILRHRPNRHKFRHFARSDLGWIIL